jgi:hypothetical protein
VINMKARVNLNLLKTTTFDSGALGMLAMVVHQFPAAGYYRAAILRDGKSKAEVGFEVREGIEQIQLDIDLATCEREANARRDECAQQGETTAVGVVSPNGYVLFHASSGDGYSVIVTREGEEGVFDSTRLGRGDIFALSLLEPGTYAMVNRIGNATGQIEVKLPSEEVLHNNQLETQSVDTSQRSFEPGRIELVSSQGLVFRVNDSARIVIEKRGADAEERPKQVYRWQKMESGSRPGSERGI